MVHLSRFRPFDCVYTLVLVFFVGFTKADAGDFCFIDNSLKYCDYGCCSNKCCDMTTMAIVGLVIGAVIGLAAIIGCVVCLVCMCKQSKASRNGNMVQPYHNTNSVYVHNSTHPPSRHPPPSYGHPPPSYGQYGQYGSYPGSTDTNYGFNDAAYPPGSHPPPAYTYSEPRFNKSN